MNKTEEAYSKELEAQRIAGVILFWWFESWKFRLAAKATWYTPDFIVMLPDGRLEAHEVKGHMEVAAAIKIRLFNTLYPIPIQVVRWVKKAWIIEVFDTLEIREERAVASPKPRRSKLDQQPALL